MTERKVLVVDATAERREGMNRTTWQDAGVAAWLGEHAIAIQIDVDAARDVQGRAADRIDADHRRAPWRAGARPCRRREEAGELVAWLDDVARGVTPFILRTPRAVGNPLGYIAVAMRADATRALTQTGDHAGALAEYLWLWNHMVEHSPLHRNDRSAEVAHALQALGAVYPPAAAAVVALRDGVEPAPRGPIEHDAFYDWAVLNWALAEDARTLAWFDALPAARRGQLGALFDHVVVPLLTEAGRWEDIGTHYDAPIDLLYDLAGMVIRAAHEARRGNIDAFAPMPEELLSRSETIVRALRAAGRSDEADAVTVRAREIALELAALPPAPPT